MNLFVAHCMAIIGCLAVFVRRMMDINIDIIVCFILISLFYYCNFDKESMSGSTWKQP